MGNKGRGYHGHSREHGLHSKGIKTKSSGCKPQPKSRVSRGLEDRPNNASPYFDYDLSNYNFPFIRDIYEEQEYNDRINERTHEVIFITTDEYLKAIKEAKDVDPYVFEKKVEAIKKDMEKGDRFAMPYLEYRVLYWDGKPSSTFGQEGIHRAIASKQLGHEVIPVVVIYPSTKEKFDVVHKNISVKVLLKLDLSKVRTHEERRQEYEKKYGKHWNL